MFEKLKFWLVLAVALLVVTYLLPVQSIASYMVYSFYTKNDLVINLSLVNPEVEFLSADPSNKLIARVEVRNSSGMPISNARIRLSVSNGMGELYPSDTRTDKYGECLVTYIPPALKFQQLKSTGIDTTITASIFKTSANSSVKITLVSTPVIFVHGYQANGQIFDNLKEYLQEKGYKGEALTYKSENGVVNGANDFKDFIQEQKNTYLSEGLQVRKFDVVAHSMGGLLARYYTCSEDYIKNIDVRKIIFVSVPNKGSPWASIGASYFNDQSIKDLIPDNTLLTQTLPGMINKGLNNNIQVGSIMAQYDEVVNPESASLEEWNIKTEVFNIGESNFNMDNLLSGNLLEAPNHKNILNNTKVFEKIESMLDCDLPYPTVRK